MSAAPAAPRVLQPAAWRRAVAPSVVAVLVLSVVLQEPVAAVLPAGTPRILVFVAIAAPIVAAIALGLGAAYPRVLVDADGSLRVRGRTVRSSEIVGVRRSVSSGNGAAYLVLTFRTVDGRGIRVLVAGAPVRGLDSDQLRVLRETVAASAIPVKSESASERAFLTESVLASGRRVEADRGLVLRELDELRGVPFTGLGMAPAEADADLQRAHEIAPDAVLAADDETDAAAAREVAVATRTSSLVRRIAFWLLVAASAVAAVILVFLVVVESGGVDFGAADEDPAVAAMSSAILGALLACLAWAIAADVDDARVRAASLRWLDDASAAEPRRGLPAPFQAAWLQPPGGRMLSLALLVLGVVALLTVIGGPLALMQGYGPVGVGIVVTIAGVGLAALAVWAWYARRRAHARRVEWLLEVAGAVGPGGAPGPDARTR